MEAEVKTKSDNYIQLKNENVVRFEIKDMDGVPTGDYLEFDLEDIELPLIYQDIIEEDKRNRTNLRNQLIIIDKKQDHKGKKLLSSNEEEKIKAMNEFYKKEVETLNKFLGENGVQKLLCGRKIGWTTLAEISEIVDKVIAPKLNMTMDNISKRIKEKYGNNLVKKEDNTLE